MVADGVLVEVPMVEKSLCCCYFLLDSAKQLWILFGVLAIVLAGDGFLSLPAEVLLVVVRTALVAIPLEAVVVAMSS